MPYRFQLVNKPKYRCPSCGTDKKLSRYYDNAKNEFLSEYEYGRCDREIDCGFHSIPKDDGSYKGFSKNVIEKVEEKPFNVIPYEFVRKSVSNKYSDNFSVFLFNHFSDRQEIVKEVLDSYKVGVSNVFGGKSTVFWQISKEGVRSGKIMQYNPETGKRKKGGVFTTWVHTELYKNTEYVLKQVFFGNHLVKYGDKIVIVESEKTAIICAIYFYGQGYKFISSGMLQGLQEHKFAALPKYIKEYIFIPDFGKATEIWRKKVEELGLKNARITTFEDVNEGDDIADIIFLGKNLEL